jgi:hypothetical protein
VENTVNFLLYIEINFNNLGIKVDLFHINTGYLNLHVKDHGLFHILLT